MGNEDYNEIGLKLNEMDNEYKCFVDLIQEMTGSQVSPKQL